MNRKITVKRPGVLRDRAGAVDKCVRRMLISAEDLELLRDEIVYYGFYHSRVSAEQQLGHGIP